jgi:hypothetical protein
MNVKFLLILGFLIIDSFIRFFIYFGKNNTDLHDFIHQLPIIINLEYINFLLKMIKQLIEGRTISLNFFPVL